MRPWQKLSLLALGYWLVTGIVSCLCYTVFVSDTICRYAVMADYFAQGDFTMAYHPRFGILWPTLVGIIVYLTGLTSVKACQLTAFFFIAISIFPMWYIIRKLFDETTAWFSAIMLLVLPEIFVYSLDGLRESARMFGIIMTCGAFVLSMRSWMIAIGIFVLITCRADSWIIGMLFFMIWIIITVSRHELKKLAFPAMAVIFANIALCLVTYVHIGIFVPYTQMIWITTRSLLKWS